MRRALSLRLCRRPNLNEVWRLSTGIWCPVKSWIMKRNRKNFTEAYLRSQYFVVKKSQQVTKRTTDNSNGLENLPQLWCVRRSRMQVSDHKTVIRASSVCAVEYRPWPKWDVFDDTGVYIVDFLIMSCCKFPLMEWNLSNDDTEFASHM